MSKFGSFVLPDVGEGLVEAEIVSWAVAVGDVVVVNQVLVEIETAKSVVELPSPWGGVVERILFEVGDVVSVGSVIVVIALSVEEPVVPVVGGSLGSGGGAANFVGSGPRVDVLQARARKAVGVVEEVGVGGRVLAKPPVRKLARDLGVDLSQVVGSGGLGQVLREDVLGFVGSSGGVSLEGSGGLEERVLVRGVRKLTAAAMVESAFSAPHVSVFLDVDVTRTVEFVKKLQGSAKFAGLKVSSLLVVLKAVLWAVERNPQVNSVWGEEEIVVKKYVNLGVAAATKRGLLVPNIKNAQDLSLFQLAVALRDLVVVAREGKTVPSAMLGGTLTVSNVGVLGVDFGTPILNPGEVTIVVFGAVKLRPWVVDGVVVPRWVTTLGASFDHRVVDGDLGGRFLSDVGSVLEEPALLLG